MNLGTDPQPVSRSWHQVSIQFDYSAAERTGVAHIGPCWSVCDGGHVCAETALAIGVASGRFRDGSRAGHG